MNNIKAIRTIVLIVLVSFVIIVGLFALLAFGIEECLIQRFMLWGTWALGLGSFATAMIAIIISLFTFFKTNKKE